MNTCQGREVWEGPLAGAHDRPRLHVDLNHAASRFSWMSLFTPATKKSVLREDLCVGSNYSKRLQDNILPRWHTQRLTKVSWQRFVNPFFGLYSSTTHNLTARRITEKDCTGASVMQILSGRISVTQHQRSSYVTGMQGEGWMCLFSVYSKWTRGTRVNPGWAKLNKK